MADESDCSACPLHPERRRFLRSAGAALASLGLLGILPRDAGAASPRAIGVRPAEPHDGRDERRYPLPAADGVFIDRDNGVIVARANGKVYAFSLACPHQNTALRWDADAHEFRCPKHKSRYRDDGAFIDGRATRSMDRLAVRRDGAMLVVDIDALFQQDEQSKQWEEAFVTA